MNPPDHSHAAFAIRLRECISRTGGISLLAKASGVHRNTIQGYRKKYEPDRVTLIKIANAAGVTPEYLTTGFIRPAAEPLIAGHPVIPPDHSHALFALRLRECVLKTGGISHLAKASDVHRNTIQGYLKKYEPDRRTLIKLATAGGVTPEYLATGFPVSPAETLPAAQPPAGLVSASMDLKAAHEPTEKLSHALSGAAGEFFVAAELSCRGYLATITNRYAEKVDVLATKADSGRVLKIQVKTIQEGVRHWVLSDKNAVEHGPNFYYIFVRLLGKSIRPAFHIVPAAEVAARIKAGHANWLSGTKRDGSARSDTRMRGFDDYENAFLEKWELLEIE